MGLDIEKVLSGEVWRLVSFLFVPNNTSPLWIVLSLYLYYMIGTSLENAWGSFQFNVYYLIGILGSVAAAFITGYGTNAYINLSLFFAFAILYPDHKILFFFVIPVKIKWLALVDAVFYGYLIIISIITNNWVTAAAVVASLINLLIFFTKDLFLKTKHNLAYQKTRRQYKSQQREWEKNRHSQDDNNNRYH